MTRGRRVRGCAVAAVVVLALAGCLPTTTTAAMTADQGGGEAAAGFEGALVEDAPTIPDVAFTDSDGAPYDLGAAMHERPTLLYVGYTHCPDICPVHLATLAQALRESTVRPEQLNIVFVTADPRRDTPEVLGDYLDAFDPSFVGLRANPEAVDRMLRLLGLPTIVIEEGASDAEGYTVGHPGQVLAFDTNARARLQYPFGTRQSQWVTDLPKFVRGDWPT